MQQKQKTMQKKSENVIPFAQKRERPLTILTVEDDDLEQELLGEQIAGFGHLSIAAKNGEQAMTILQKKYEDIDIVLMDRRMPAMDGLTAVRHIKEHPKMRKIPVVMLTGAAGRKEMQEGLEAGVFYYLTKPVDENVLRSVLIAAAREAQQNRVLADGLRHRRNGFSMIHVCKFSFRTIEEAECLAAFAAQCFPDPERVLPGLGELLINAVEHGILEIGYENKTNLLNHDALRTEIERRQNLEEYKNRSAELLITRRDEGLYAVVSDHGKGFEWRRYMSIDPARAGDNHGRGIAQAAVMSFDKLSFNETGNQAIAFVTEYRDLQW